MHSRIPPSHVDLLTTGIVGHLTTIRPDGALAPSIVWIDFDGEHILTSSPIDSAKSRHVRAHPNVALSVVDPTNVWRYLQVRGHVSAIRPDDGLVFIDAMARRYLGHDYSDRDELREVFEITVDHVRARPA